MTTKGGADNWSSLIEWSAPSVMGIAALPNATMRMRELEHLSDRYVVFSNFPSMSDPAFSALTTAVYGSAASSPSLNRLRASFRSTMICDLVALEY